MAPPVVPDSPRADGREDADEQRSCDDPTGSLRPRTVARCSNHTRGIADIGPCHTGAHILPVANPRERSARPVRPRRAASPSCRTPQGSRALPPVSSHSPSSDRALTTTRARVSAPQGRTPRWRNAWPHRSLPRMRRRAKVMRARACVMPRRWGPGGSHPETLLRLLFVTRVRLQCREGQRAPLERRTSGLAPVAGHALGADRDRTAVGRCDLPQHE
jgi:hypothetical protein